MTGINVDRSRTSRTGLRRAAVLGLAVALGLVACGSPSPADEASSAILTPPPAATDAGSSGPTASTAGGVPSAGPPATEIPSSGADASIPPDCSRGPTSSSTEGPYFTAGSPLAPDLVEAGMAGTALTLELVVVSLTCTPIEGAKVDVWQADAAGVYDNVGYRLRGHVFTDGSGRATIRTIVPGEYPGRTPHIHVKVTPPGGTTLTTQLYLPGVAGNEADRIFDEGLVIETRQMPSGLVGSYVFVLGD